MKRINFYITITLLLLSGACTSDYMDIKPATLIEEEYYKDPDNIYMAIIGCYDVLGWDSEHNTIPYFFGDIIGRDAYKGGDIGGDQPWMDGLLDFTYNATNIMLNKVWTNYYIGINRCNKLLENIDLSVALTTEERDRYIAEAKFLRAYYHFELVKLFGEVPLIDHLLQPSEYIGKKSTLKELYDFIETDLDDAIADLPARSEVEANSEFGRVTRDAAKAILAKAYMYQQKYAEAATVTDEIIASKEYDLMPNYGDVFQLANEHNRELIFEIEFRDHLNQWGNESNGNMLTIYMQGRDHTVGGGAGWGFDCPTQEFADEFEAGDPRLGATVITNGETLYEGTADAETYNMDDPKDYATNYDKMLNKKYHLKLSEQGKYPMDQPKNWIVCRFAQVLLWNAEAKAQTGGDWQTPLQRVRDRVNMGATPYTNALEAIYHEQRVELGMEGHIFWELVRQGRAQDVLGEYGFVYGNNDYFPIPQTQIDLNGGGF